MDINTADSLLNTDCLIPINRDGKEFYYWKIDLPPSLQEEVRLKILGEKLANISPGRRNEFKKQTKKDFGADFYHTNSRQIYYGNKLALEHILGNNSIRKMLIGFMLIIYTDLGIFTRLIYTCLQNHLFGL